MHPSRDRQSIERRLNDRRQQVPDALTWLRADEEQERAFTFVDLLQGLDRRAAALSEGQGRACGESGGVERGGHGRAAPPDGLIRLLRGHFPDVYGQASRGRKGHHGADLESGVLQSRANAGGEGALEGPKRFGRQLLGSQLNQEVALVEAHACAPATSFSAGVPPPGLANMGNPSASRLAK